MTNYNTIKKVVLTVYVFIFLTFCLFQFIPLSFAQANGEAVSFSSSLEFNEYSEIKGIESNASGLNILLPEENWTVTDIHINFSDISLSNEIVSIEESETGTELLWHKNPSFKTFALGTQLEIMEETELFGVYIKGYKTEQATETIKFQIQGFNEGTKSPNNTIYRSIDLNISLNLDWYYQDFSLDPLTLKAGNYSLVMNGTNLSPNADAKYYWQKDHLDPDIPFLHTSLYETSWAIGTVNTSFLYRLNQRVNRSYSPSELNMTAEIDGENYDVINGVETDTGLLDITDLNHFHETLNLNIPININRTITLNFNYNYSIKLKNSFQSKSLATIEEKHNYWLTSPLIDRITQNYYVQFEIPKSWYNFTISRKLTGLWENVTSLVNIDPINNSISIPNNTIEVGAEWKIESYSQNINFDIEMTTTDLNRGDELEISVTTPIIQGNLTFLILKPSGRIELIDTENSVSGLIFFSYQIPQNWTEGDYAGLVYWNNHTDIGIQNKDFKILIPPVPFTFEPWMIFVTVFGTLGIITVGIISYHYIKKFRNIQLEKKQKLYDSCIDILNLDYFIVTDKKSGLNVYTQSFTEREIEASLISGFLQAIHSFGIELIKVEDQSQTIKLEYKNSIVLMSEFVNVRLIFVMKERPSRFFLYSIEELAYDVYKNYGSMIDSFKGDVKAYQSIKILLNKHLNLSFITPLKVARIEKLEKIRITQNQKLFINKAITNMKTNNQDQFLIKNILPEKECSPKDVEVILDLIDKKIFQIV